MKIPVSPPPVTALIDELASAEGGASRFAEIATQGIGPTPDGNYRHWDIVRHLEPLDGLSPQEWWLGIKLARQFLFQSLPIRDSAGAPFQYAPVNLIHRMLHEIDKNAARAIKSTEQLAQITDPQQKETYLIKSLVEEAITSSQLEGAATTWRVAKEMLRERRQPRTRSEQMIFNNYEAMLFIRELDTQPLTENVILQLQHILTEHTLDDPNDAGRIRNERDNVEVVDESDGKVLHTPPSAEELPTRLKTLCAFANAESEEPFVHPVVRSILLHFGLAYDHPFVDGNGRTARALFYWSMRRHGYWLSEFVSISSILKHAPTQYARSFLYTETDEGDATYFIVYQLEVFLRAIEELYDYLKKKTREFRETELLLRRSPLFSRLNHRQLALINHALKNPRFVYTIESHRGSHNVSYQTARTDLIWLAKYGLLDQGKRGKAFVFSAPEDLSSRFQGVGED